VKRLTGDERLALTALGAIVAVTVAWWLLALWPVQAAPEWLSRTRAVCFGAAPGGLPDGGGWILLVGQPLSMLGFLLIVWGGTVRRSLATVVALRSGRLATGAVGLVLAAGLVAAGFRVVAATESGSDTSMMVDAATVARLDRPAPPLRLTDQRGDVIDPGTLGRTVLLTFAYAHCETVCPVIVRQVVAARDRAGQDDVAVVVVTLDPWRDTPARLLSIAARWGLHEDDYVLSGAVADVLAVLEAWRIPITRHENTGVIDHPAIVYVLDDAGRIAFETTGGTATVADLLRRLRSSPATGP
jgi:protein SCO1/2